MSKRNLILLIIILVAAVAVTFGFLYFYRPAPTGETTEGTNFFANFLPFGKKETTTPKSETPPVDISGFEPAAPTETGLKLRRVSSFPVAGFGVFMKERFKDMPEAVPIEENPTPTKKNTKPILPPTEFVAALRYADKATGNIYQTFADKLDERKFSSMVIPQVHEAYFGNKGESVVIRYLKDKIIETFVGALQKEYLGADSVGTNQVTGSFLPENISDVSISSDGSKMFYLFGSGDGATGVTFAFSSNAKVQVFDSPFTEWLSQWPKSSMITVTTKPSAQVPGFMYAINPDKKDFNKILGGINGLTTLGSPDGKMVLYGDSSLTLNIFNLDSGSSESIPLKTLPEKCVWNSSSDALYCAVPKFINQGEYPDAWYRGEVSFSDDIWKIDIKSGNTTLLLNPASVENGAEIDGIKLTLDEKEDYLFFLNKKDSYLWEMSLK